MKRLNVLMGAAMALALATSAEAVTIPTGATLPNGTAMTIQPVVVLDGNGNISSPGALPASGFTPVTLSITTTAASSPITGLVAGRPINLNFAPGTGTGTCTLLGNPDGTNYVTIGIAGTAFPSITYSGAGLTDSSGIIYQSGENVEVICSGVTGTIPLKVSQ